MQILPFQVMILPGDDLAKDWIELIWSSTRTLYRHSAGLLFVSAIHICNYVTTILSQIVVVINWLLKSLVIINIGTARQSNIAMQVPGSCNKVLCVLLHKEYSRTMRATMLSTIQLYLRRLTLASWMDCTKPSNKRGIRYMWQATRFMRRYCPSGQHGSSRFWLRVFDFSSLVRGVMSKLMSFLGSWLI